MINEVPFMLDFMQIHQAERELHTYILVQGRGNCLSRKHTYSYVLANPCSLFRDLLEQRLFCNFYHIEKKYAVFARFSFFNFLGRFLKYSQKLNSNQSSENL